MAKFDTTVQLLKYKVLKSVAKHAFEDRLLECFTEIPKEIIPGPKPTTRCCVYKERAIVGERIKLAMGGDKENPNVIEVIDIACDECPVGGYYVTDACRGCIAHRCANACRKGAITFDDKLKAHIDKSKCVNCGLCANVCPYNAIGNRKRPCENACKVKAISMNEETHAAQISEEKCIRCGACVYQCPFGAINDKSYIVDVIDMIKKSNGNTNYKVYAIVAPSISAQFPSIKLGQVISAMKQIGFFSVVEAALGADMVAMKETKELYEKGFLTSSCCPAFVSFIEKNFPTMVDKISHNFSPMAELGKYIKEIDPTSKIVFIGPCTSKKMEFQKEKVKPYVDSVLTFEELQALIDSKDIDMAAMPLDYLDNASYFGRIFARVGGLTDAVKQAATELNLDTSILNPLVCDGIEQCKMALMKASRGMLPNNFVEGMACVGGCIGGPCNLTHEPKDKNEVDKYGREAMEKTISDAIGILNK